MNPVEIQQAKRKTVIWLLVLVFGMLAFAFAQVQLYGLFCQALGVNSLSARTPVNQEYLLASQNQKTHTSNRIVTVRFDATVNSGLPWSFQPIEKKVELSPGEYKKISYQVKNLSNEMIVGQSIASVVPWQAQPYLTKLDCFCFSQQTLQAHEEKEMPLVFTLSPELPEGMNTLVLSYTFLNADKNSAKKYQQLTPSSNGNTEIKTM